MTSLPHSRRRSFCQHCESTHRNNQSHDKSQPEHPRSPAATSTCQKDADDIDPELHHRSSARVAHATLQIHQLISPPSRWRKGAPATRPAYPTIHTAPEPDQPTNPTSDQANSWTLADAVINICDRMTVFSDVAAQTKNHTFLYITAAILLYEPPLDQHHACPIQAFNDHSATTKDQVLQVIRTAHQMAALNAGQNARLD